MLTRFERKRCVPALLLTLALLFSGAAWAEAPDIPDFGGTAVIALNQNRPVFQPDAAAAGDYVVYSELDELDRPGAASACISRASLPTGPRAEGGDVLPVGWRTAQDDSAAQYSLCRVLAPALGGSDTDARNVFTGTRYLREEGMRPFEDRVADFLGRTAYHVLYRVTPVYRGDELLPTGVQLEAYSVEDSGRSLCFNVFAYNVQPGFRIDYGSGESVPDTGVGVVASAGEVLKSHWLEPLTGMEPSSAHSFKDLFPSPTPAANTAASSSGARRFVLDTSTKVYHTKNCGHLPTKNRQDYTGTLEEVLAMGYSTWCDWCRGQ